MLFLSELFRVLPALCGMWKDSTLKVFLVFVTSDKTSGGASFLHCTITMRQKWRNGNFWDEMSSKDTGESYASVQSAYELHENGYLWGYALLLSLQKIIYKLLRHLKISVLQPQLAFGKHGFPPIHIYTVSSSMKWK